MKDETNHTANYEGSRTEKYWVLDFILFFIRGSMGDYIYVIFGRKYKSINFGG